jgi:hypothetical protein
MFRSARVLLGGLRLSLHDQAMFANKFAKTFAIDESSALDLLSEVKVEDRLVLRRAHHTSMPADGNPTMPVLSNEMFYENPYVFIA